MHPTARCLGRGFLGRSLDELKQFTHRAIKLEALSRPTKAFPLILFDRAEDLEKCKRMSDKDTGGFSTVNMDFVPASGSEPAHARFHGTISTELPKDNPKIQRTGYAGWRTQDRGWSLFGKLLWDVDPYKFLAIQFKSDGRKYFVNVQTESLVPTDIHQHRLYAKAPGEWETILIKWNDFVRTNHGQVVAPQRDMLTQKVRSVGLSLIDRIPGPYDLKVSRVWATNAGREDDILSQIKGPISGFSVPSSREDKFRKTEALLRKKNEPTKISA